jgi:hypothetical protein
MRSTYEPGSLKIGDLGVHGLMLALKVYFQEVGM